jgi:hypothetical protein
MDPAVIGVFIPIIAITLSIPLAAFGVWIGHKQRVLKYELEARKLASAGSSDQVQQQAILIEVLQDRVQVLERIVTDGGYDLATRIEALRDERPALLALEARSEAERLS